jgi:hypothetical protein
MRRHNRQVPDTEARPGPEKQAPSGAEGLRGPSLLVLARPGYGPPRGGSEARLRRRAVVAAAGCCAAVVAVALVVANVANAGQRVTIRPAAQSGPAPATIFVANTGPYNNTTNQFTGPGSITVYRPGSSGDARPEAVITKGLDGPVDMAVDSSGDLWVANEDGDTVVEYSRAELAKSSPAPTMTISTATVGLAFDPSGDLWVDTGEAVEEFTKAELTKSAFRGPGFALQEVGCRFGFDSSGDLWEGSDGNTLTEWARPQLVPSYKGPTLPSGTVPTPKVIISSHMPTLGCKPIFDRAGDLWMGNDTNMVEFTKAQLAKSSSTVPTVVISSPGLSDLIDIAFDPSGDLWAPNHVRNSAVVEFTKAQLVKSGAVAPAKIISGPATGLNYSIDVAIEP